MVTDAVDVARAYAHCERVAREHYENFPVASRLLPAPTRPHIAAIYAFARRADDYADEPGLPDAQRVQRIDDWHARLMRAASGQPTGSTTSDDLVFLALRRTIAEFELPVSLFEDLLSAFRQDVTTRRYTHWNDVLDYCRRSANPVGRLVLRVAGYRDDRMDRCSDAVCTALQLANFWQDLERDWAIGRLYVPQTDRLDAPEADLTARRMTPAWQRVMAEMTRRTRELFGAGRPVCDMVKGRLRWELRLTWLGGSRILDKLEAARFDVFRSRPTLGAPDVAPLVWQALTWRRRPI